MKTLQDQYCSLIEKRDLYWVQQLVLELKIPAGGSLNSPNRPLIILGELRMVIERIEKSLVYMRRWAKSQAWNVDFTIIERHYQREQRSRDHPCRLLQPYIVEIPVALPPEEYSDSAW